MGRIQSYVVGPREKTIQTVEVTVVKLYNVTIMSVVSGMGRTYKPAIVFSRWELHYKVVWNDK